MKRAVVELFDLSVRAVEKSIENGSSPFTEKTVDQLKTMSEISEISDEKFEQYYTNLFREKLYNKTTKYKFLWDHMKVFGHVAKNRIELRLGENVSLEKMEQINLTLPLADIYIEVNNMKYRHEQRMNDNPTVYTKKDEEYSLFFELTYRLYDIFFYLEKDTSKKSAIESIKTWCEKVSNGQNPDEQSDLTSEEMFARVQETIKKTNIKGLVSGMLGEEVAEKMNLDAVIDKMTGDPEVLAKIQSGDFNPSDTDFLQQFAPGGLDVSSSDDEEEPRDDRELMSDTELMSDSEFDVDYNASFSGDELD